MAMVTPQNTKLELRRDDKNRFVLFFDGERVPGVIETVMSQVARDRPVFTITVHGNAVRMVENDPVIDCDSEVSA